MKSEDEAGKRPPASQGTFADDVDEISHYLARLLTEQIDQLEKTFNHMLADVRGIGNLLVSGRIAVSHARAMHIPQRLLNQIQKLDKQMKKLDRLPPVLLSVIWLSYHQEYNVMSAYKICL